MGESGDASGAGLKILGEFLRAKRKAIAPDERGIATRRRRLTPGLSREETAALADISASWYARLEAGRVPNPSLATMRAIAHALGLSAAEETFAFQLAGILSHSEADTELIALRPLAALLDGADLVALSLWDRYLTPIGWNAIAGAMYHFSDYDDSISRHPIVRLEDENTLLFFGDAYEDWARNVVGMFRRAFSTGEPTPYAREVLERAEQLDIFKKYWLAHAVSDSPSPHGEVIVRNHPVVGPFRGLPVDLGVPEQRLLRIISPADDESRRKFERLREIGTPCIGDAAMHAAG